MPRNDPSRMRCAVYTRKSSEEGLEQEFNSLDAQYDAASAYIKSQAHAGWTLIRSRYDDGGYSGGSTDRPDLQKLLEDIRARKIDVIVEVAACGGMSLAEMQAFISGSLHPNQKQLEALARRMQVKDA